MSISTHEKNGVVILEPEGKIMGGPEATELRNRLYELISTDNKKVVIDLGHVEWMNSTGLGILISGMTSLRNNEGELKLSNISEKVANLFEITKLNNVFDSYDSADDAVGSFE
jgi:anti-sigma B factor antagonist